MDNQLRPVNILPTVSDMLAVQHRVCGGHLPPTAATTLARWEVGEHSSSISFSQLECVEKCLGMDAESVASCITAQAQSELVSTLLLLISNPAGDQRCCFQICLSQASTF